MHSIRNIVDTGMEIINEDEMTIYVNQPIKPIGWRDRDDNNDSSSSLYSVICGIIT